MPYHSKYDKKMFKYYRIHKYKLKIGMQQIISSSAYQRNDDKITIQCSQCRFSITVLKFSCHNTQYKTTEQTQEHVEKLGTVRQWCRMFKDGWTNVHDEERSGWPSVVNDDLVQSVDQKICERQHLQFQNICVNFHKFHTLFSTRLSQLG
jgi:hypothetical protein